MQTNLTNVLFVCLSSLFLSFSQFLGSCSRKVFRKTGESDIELMVDECDTYASLARAGL